MATQQLMFDILASAKNVASTFDGVVSDANSMADRMGSAGDNASKKLFSPMKLAGGAGAAAGAALLSGLDTAINMDAVTSKMTAGLNLAAEPAAAAGSAAGELYAAGYGESFEEVSAAVGATLSSISGMSSASQSEMENVTGKVLDLSSAFDLDVGRAAQVAGQMIKTGLAKDGVEAADLLTATLSKVPQAIQADVLDAVDEYGPMFAQLGFNGGEAMTMLADASAQGAYGIDKTGDAFKELTIRAGDGSKASVDAMTAIGLDAGKIATAITGGGADGRAAMEEIAMGLAGISDPALQAQTAIGLFGTPLEDLGTENIPAFIESILNSQEALGTVEGAAESLGEKLHSGPASAMTELKRTAETTLGELGAQMLPVLTPLLEGLQQFAPILGPAVLILGALAAVIAIVVAVTAAWNAVLAFSPVTWIVIGIVALIAAIVALVMNWDTVVAWITQIWGGFVNWLTEILNGFVAWWNEIWGGFANWIVGLWQSLVAGITALWQGYVAWISGMILGFVAWWNELWGGFANWIVGLWQSFTGGLSALWSGFVAWILGVVNGFVSFLVGAFQGVVSTAMAIWSGLGGFFSGLWNGIVSGVSGLIGTVGSYFSGLPATIMGLFAGAGQWLWDAGRNVVQGLMNGVKSLASTIGNFFLDLLPGWIVKPFKIALGINSPSRVFAGFGQNLGEGVLIGVGRTQGRIDDRMANLVTVPDLPTFGGGTGDLGGSAGGTAAGRRNGTDRTTPGLTIENLNVSEASTGSWQGLGNQILQAAQVQAPRVFI